MICRSPLFFLATLFFLASISSGASPRYPNEPLKPELIKISIAGAKPVTGIIEFPQNEIIGAVLIIQGSGPTVGADGDVSSPFLGKGYQESVYNGPNTKLSEQVAAQLAKAGIASLRYSKRGVEETAQLPNQKFPYLVDDAKVAFQELKTRFPKLKTGVIGFSEGALVASLLANDISVDGLYLLSTPTRPIDEILNYQFIEWPKKIMLNRMANRFPGLRSTIDVSVLASDSFKNMPLSSLMSDVGRPITAEALDFYEHAHHGRMSVSNVMILYRSFYNYFWDLLLRTGAGASAWYESLKVLPPHAQIASKIKSKTIYLYEPLANTQTNSKWIEEDKVWYSSNPIIRYFKNVGHCFSPMEGLYGQVKTAGPFSNELLDQLSKDIRANSQKI